MKHTFLGLEFEETPQGPDLIIGNFQLCVGRGGYRICTLEHAQRFAGMTLAAPDLPSLEALCRNLIERRTPLGLELDAAVKAELERRKPKLPERVGPWEVVRSHGWVWLHLEDYVIRASARTGLAEAQLIPELTRITLETLVDLMGGWRGPSSVAKDGWYLWRDWAGNQGIAQLRAQQGTVHGEHCGPLPIEALAKVWGRSEPAPAAAANPSNPCCETPEPFTVWRTAEGVDVKVTEMTDAHLRNTIQWLQDNESADSRIDSRRWQSVFRAEQARRGRP